MSPSSAVARHLWTTRFVAFFVLLAVAAAVGVGSQSFARPIAALCALLTGAFLTWRSAQWATRVALLLLFVTPFLAVIPQLKPDQVNYSVYYCLFAVAVAIVICAKAQRIAFDSGAVLLVAILVSSLVTLLVGGALATGYWFALWPLTTLAVYLLLLNSAENGHSWLLSLIVAFSLIQALLGISQSLFHWPVFSLALPRLFESNRGPLGFILPGFSRMVSLGSGTFRHPNGLGGLLALALPICFGWLLESPRSFRRLLPFAILVIGLLMSYSRGGWLGGAVGCILAYWAARPRASRPLVTLLESPRSFPRLLPFTILATGLLTSYLGGGWVGGAVGCILAYWASRPWASRPWVPLLSEGVLLMAALSAPSIAAYYDATQNVTSRVATWHYGFTYWLQHPASIPFGAGFGSFQQTILMQRIWQGGRILSALHSGFLQILLEMGIAGLLVFGWFLITTIRPFAIDRRPGWQTWALGGLVGFLVSQMFDNALFGLVAGVCAFALAACLRRADARHEAG